MTPANLQWDIFLAHAGPDGAAASELFRFLTPGCRVFLDSKCLRLGDDFDKALGEAQRNALVTAVLVSPHTDQAYYQREEIGAAIQLARQDSERHRVVPVYLDSDVRGSLQVPYGLTLKHALSVRAEGGLEGVATRLRELCSRLKGAPSAASPRDQAVVALDLSHQQSSWDQLATLRETAQVSIQPVFRGLLDERDTIDQCRVLVMALPFHCLLSRPEIDYVDSWVRRGGGLFLMGYYAADLHHLSNPSALARALGFEFGGDLVMRPGATKDDCRRHVFRLDPALAVEAADPDARHPIMTGVKRLAFLSCCSLDVTSAPRDTYVLRAPAESAVWLPKGPKDPDGGMRIIETWELNRQAPAPLLAACEHGRGRAVLCGTWKICTLDEGDNRRLVGNVLEWLSGS